jgi:GNAT superfamily N-acetyltransferase
VPCKQLIGAEIEDVGGVRVRVYDRGEFCCEVTGFRGYEEEILRLRNANRESPETLEYLDWRYRRSSDSPEPQVFWLLTSQRRRIGMASVVFRPYWINNVRVQTGVVGDISLDSAWRGRGLGQVLLRFMTEYLDEHFPQLPAFVIPTAAARGAFTNVGWVTSGALIPHVYVLDVTRYVRALVRSGWLATYIARGVRTLARIVTRLRAPRDGLLHLKSTPDEPLLEFARRLPPPGGAVRYLGPEALNWRYAQHPHTRFTFARFTSFDETRGLLVFEDSTLERTWSIYDVAAKTPADLRAMLTLFVERALSVPDLVALRVTLSERHPCRTHLRRLGFIARRPDAVFQVHARCSASERLAWFVTHGDKDT